MKKTFYIVLVIALGIACSDSNVEPAASNNSNNSNAGNEISAVARNYLNEVIGIMQSHSINKNDINWSDLREEAFAEVANNAQTIEDTYPGILKAIELLGDNHSFYETSSGNFLNPNSVSCNGTASINSDLPDNIGYVKVSNFSGSVFGTDGIAFAEAIQNEIRLQDNASIIGWIVDLRANTGGNMWPMLAGIGPVLGEGTAGYFLDADGEEVAWGFENGAAQLDGQQLTGIEDSYTLVNQNPKVAVLIDNGVASSGEAIAVSFLGRPNTRTFGSATCGLSTANTPYALSDNAVLYLTTAFFTDRDFNVYGAQIEPDQNVTTEFIYQEAIGWLNN